MRRWKTYRERLKDCRNEPSVELVHELRVAMRRLFSQFVLVGHMVPTDKPNKARDILKRQLELLSALRDRHVQILFIRQHVQQFPESASLLAYLEGLEPSLTKAASREIRRFKTGKLEKWVRSLVGEIQEDASNPRMQREWGSAALHCADAAFAEAVQRRHNIKATDLLTIHRTRVAFKRFRYIVESLPAELTSLGKNDLRALARYQRWMGAIQDCEVILEAINGYTKRHPRAPLKRLNGYLRRHRSRRIRTFLKSADKLFQFWPPRKLSAAVP